VSLTSAEVTALRRNEPTDLSVGAVVDAARSVSIDQVGVEERAASFAKRSVKADAKLWGLDLVIRTIDLTTLEGADTPGKVRALSAKAIHPDPTNPDLPSVAALCVYPNLVPVAVRALEGSGVHVASVATGFPSGQVPFSAKLDDVRAAVEAGADEIDMVIDRGAFLRGDFATVYEEIKRIREACGEAHLKVILETGELGSYDDVRTASWIAMAAGADFIKTSTGKIGAAATMPVTLVMLDAIRDYWELTGIKIGMKPAGGIRTSKQALHYLVMLNETLGLEWMRPELWRFGASSLLNDVLMQLRTQATGSYSGADYFTLD
jgi:deoxyribose-phosphate aldolase